MLKIWRKICARLLQILSQKPFFLEESQVLQKKEKLFLALSLAAVVLCTALAFSFAVPLQAAEPQVLPDTTGLEQYVLVDLNTADLSALCTLPGVGEKRAQTILDYRTQNGPFERVEDAANVPGLTQTIVDSWAGMATVS